MNDIVSVVIPCCNSAKKLHRCIESVRNQTCHSLEIILIDDGSTDDTGKICDEYREKDTRFRVIHQKNKGLMHAWQQGVKTAQGEYVAFTDADDWIEADMIARMYEKAVRYDADMVIVGMQIDYADGHNRQEQQQLSSGYYDNMAICTRIYPCLFGTNTLQSPAIHASRCIKLIRKELLMKNMKLLPQDLDIGENDLTTFAVILDVKSLYLFSDYYPYHYVRNSDSMVSKASSCPQDMYVKYRRVCLELKKLADIKGYPYKKQISWHFLWLVTMGLKKTAQDRRISFWNRCRILRCEYEADDVQKAVSDCRQVQKGFQTHEKIFLLLLKYRMYFACVCLLSVGKGVF